MVDLNEESTLNSLSIDQREDIWLPKIVFYNTEVKSETVNDEKASAIVHRNSDYTRRNMSYQQNAYVYQGNQNPITLSRVYSDKFICDFDMAKYPFDVQKCSVIFIMTGKFDKFVKLNGEDVSYFGPIDLTQYYIMDTEIFHTVVPPGISAVQVDISFGRRILSALLSNYLPTSLICILTFATNFFDDIYFEAVVTVNLTSMLALTTIFVSIFDSLPQTFYVKFIDIWLMFCMTIPFFEVILQVILPFIH